MTLLFNPKTDLFQAHTYCSVCDSSTPGDARETHDCQGPGDARETHDCQGPVAGNRPMLHGTSYAGRKTVFTDEIKPSTKPTNPKDAIGSDKLPLHLWPTTASAMGCLGLLDGALKYGRSNWRVAGVRASIYYDAVGRHLNAWFEGEDVDPDSGLPHMAHALACLAIIVDAEAAGKLNDDRMAPGGARKGVSALTPHVARLKALHAGKAPKHYTIADGEK